MIACAPTMDTRTCSLLEVSMEPPAQPHIIAVAAEQRQDRDDGLHFRFALSATMARRPPDDRRKEN